MLNMTPNDIPSTSTASAPIVESGVYPGVISLILDAGTQRKKKYDSRLKPDEACTDADYDVGQYIWFSYTLPTERYEVEFDGEDVLRDQILGVQYKVSDYDKSNLIKMYTAVVKDGRTFSEMLGMPVTVTTGMTSGGKAKVTNVAAPMRGSQVDAPLREPMLVTEDDWDNVDDLDLPDFLKDMIKSRVQ